MCDVALYEVALLLSPQMIFQVITVLFHLYPQLFVKKCIFSYFLPYLVLQVSTYQLTRSYHMTTTNQGGED